MLRPGDLVLVREDNLPRMKWPLGVIEEVYPGKDGLIRSVKVRMARGSLMRPIQRLHCLEVPTGESGSDDMGGDFFSQGSTPAEAPLRTQPRRPRRSVRVPDRLDL